MTTSSITFRDDGIPVDRPWGEETYQTVVGYLRERDPKAQLAEIAAGSSDCARALLGRRPAARRGRPTLRPLTDTRVRSRTH